ncbi:MAG: MotA/TolQ/ExbB proton channel family protein [Candidatus Omnitrophica bacterium]|nr:MotA/TolQ/ExbB proton channel family protein [Candidatus Omnitrophota bacterium]
MWDVIQKGGPLMWPILACSFAAFVITAERIFYLQKVSVDARKFSEQIARSVKRNRIMDAVDLCEKTPGPVATVLKEGILKHDRPRAEIREAIEDAALHEVPQLERRLPVLATIAHISPLLGLLGTVTGMVEAFQVIQEKSSAVSPLNPGDLAGGIWQALLTTVVGLCVAIPTYVAYNYLTSRVDGLVLDMEKGATDLLSTLSEKRDVPEV